MKNAALHPRGMFGTEHTLHNDHKNCTASSHYSTVHDICIVHAYARARVAIAKSWRQGQPWISPHNTLGWWMSSSPMGNAPRSPSEGYHPKSPSSTSRPVSCSINIIVLKRSAGHCVSSPWPQPLAHIPTCRPQPPKGLMRPGTGRGALRVHSKIRMLHSPGHEKGSEAGSPKSNQQSIQ